MDEKLLHDAYSIFREAFHSNMSYECFHHKHADNPDIDLKIATLVDYQDGVPAGTNSFMSGVLLDGVQAMPVTQSCDTAVLPAFRGQRVFSRLIERAVSACRENSNALIYGVPNQNSRHAFAKLGFYELGKLDAYAAVVRPGRLLLRKVLGRVSEPPLFKTSPGRNGEWSLALRCPFTEEDLALINSRSGIHLKRDLSFYQWKIDYLPEGEAAYLYARQGNRLEAFLVLRRHPRGRCDLCDWMLPEDNAVSGQLLKSALRLLRPYCDLVNAPMVNPAGKEPRQLTAGGFFKKRSCPEPFMIYPTEDLGEETLSRLKDPRNWTIRYIDADTVLNG